MSDKNRQQGGNNNRISRKATGHKELRERGHYQSRYDHERERSPFLVPHSPNRGVDDEVLQANTRDGLRALIDARERRSDPESRTPPGMIEAQEQHIAELEEQADQRKQQAVAQGKRPPEAMPPDLRRELDEQLAVLDVLHDEVGKLREMLDEFQEQDREDRGREIRKRLGRGGMSNGWDNALNAPRTTLDGAFISLLRPDGSLDPYFNPRDTEAVAKAPAGAFPIIDDPASPFDGLSLLDYRERVIRNQREWPSGCTNWKETEPEGEAQEAGA